MVFSQINTSIWHACCALLSTSCFLWLSFWAFSFRFWFYKWRRYVSFFLHMMCVCVCVLLNKWIQCNVYKKNCDKNIWGEVIEIVWKITMSVMSAMLAFMVMSIWPFYINKMTFGFTTVRLFRLFVYFQLWCWCLLDVRVGCWFSHYIRYKIRESRRIHPFFYILYLKFVAHFIRISNSALCFLFSFKLLLQITAQCKL